MNSDNLTDEQKAQFEEQLEQMDSKALLAGIHSELMQIRMLLQDGTQTDSEPSEEHYECHFCSETYSKRVIQSHAVKTHKAPPNLDLQEYGKIV
jgi:hypothetical protein